MNFTQYIFIFLGMIVSTRIFATESIYYQYESKNTVQCKNLEASQFNTEKEQGEALAKCYAPSILAHKTNHPENRIGTPLIEGIEVDQKCPTMKNENAPGFYKGDVNLKECVSVRPHGRSGSDATPVYYELQEVEINGILAYQLIYRIHFSKTKGESLFKSIESHFNSGTFFMMTIDKESGQPLYFSSMATCACYFAATQVATKELIEKYGLVPWYGSQYGIKNKKGKPSKIKNVDDVHEIAGFKHKSYYPWKKGMSSVHLELESRLHRVFGVNFDGNFSVLNSTRRSYELRPLSELRRLPILLNGKNSEITSSFFYESGDYKGFVKGARNKREELYFGHLFNDSRIGWDRDFKTNGEGPFLYSITLHQKYRDMVTFSEGKDGFDNGLNFYFSYYILKTLRAPLGQRI